MTEANLKLAPRRRWSFSLRTLLLLFAAVPIAIWLSQRFDLPRRRVEQLKNYVHFEFEKPAAPPGPVESWLRGKLPQAYFDRVRLATVLSDSFGDDDLLLMEGLRPREFFFSEGRLSEKGIARIATWKQLTATALERPSDTILASFANHCKLEQLWVKGFMSDDGMRHLSGMPLKKLTLSECEVTDTGLARLCDMPSLEELMIYQTPVSAAAFARLARLPRLVRISCFNPELSDEQLAGLARIKTLQSLDLRETKLNDAGLAALAELPALETLILMRTPIGDEGVAAVVKIQSLVHLDLRSTRITGESFELLSGLPNLRELFLAGRFAPGDLDDLRSDLPADCVISGY